MHHLGDTNPHKFPFYTRHCTARQDTRHKTQAHSFHDEQTEQKRGDNIS